jgi:flagellar hook protein FlgE
VPGWHRFCRRERLWQPLFHLPEIRRAILTIRWRARLPPLPKRRFVRGGALEQSNVDIAQEFASLIIAQRGYETKARCVTTFDQVAQDTINLKQ